MLKLICESEFPGKKELKSDGTRCGPDFIIESHPLVDCDTEIKPVEDRLLPDDESVLGVLV